LPQVVMPTDDETESKTTEYTEVKDDDFDPDAKYETKVKAGEVWQLGDHRLMCGDSTKAEDIAKLMNGEQADLWLTDPPYNVGYGMQDSAQMARQNHRTDGLVVMNDRQEDSAFLQFLKDAYAAAFANMKAGASFYIWHSGLETFNFILALKENKQQLRSVLIWNKNQLVMCRQDYQWKHEPCLYGWKDGAGHKWYSDRKQTTVIDWERPKRSEEHPTMKPIGLFAYQMENSTQEGDIVLDSFGGSGTTMMAAEQLHRKARLMELDPHYCNVIIARWEKLTGQKAQKIEGV
jgi:site-specific DNA-methyltransferase (adenine-specific)